MRGMVGVRGARALGFGIVAALLCLGSCSPSPGPVAVIGLDGLEWDVVLPLLREGRMPTLEGLMREGSFGRLSTRAPARSPVIWTTVVTGKEPGGHGILGFTRPDGSGGRRLYTSADRTTKALWNILGDHDQRSIVLGWSTLQGVRTSSSRSRSRSTRIWRRSWKSVFLRRPPPPPATSPSGIPAAGRCEPTRS